MMCFKLKLFEEYNFGMQNQCLIHSRRGDRVKSEGTNIDKQKERGGVSRLSKVCPKP